MSNTLFEIRNLSKEFGSKSTKLTVLNNINLVINSGDFLAITGPSGSGKTTLLNIIAGLIKATSGELYYKDQDILKWNDSLLATYRNQEIGYVMQNFGLINSKNVLNNLLLPVKKNKKNFINKADDLLKLLVIEDKKKAYPQELSGGQKQRVSIARALINNPSVILADEPTGSLDQKNGQKILDALKEINKKGVTIILVTHEEKFANQCKSKIYLQDGEIQNYLERSI
ncbi:MAG: ABC transporter ATP-binding protein [Bacilli bacterium]